MDGTMEKDCSPLWSMYQQIVSDMKNSTPMWEEFLSKTTKLHSALKTALSAIASFLDTFQKIADAATNARGATKDIGTALTRVCLRHRAIETRLKTFINTLMETLISPLSECAEEWRRGCGTGALSREHARECKRVRAELRRRVQDAQRQARKARRTDTKKKNEGYAPDVQERKTQLEEMEEKAVKAALIEERSRFCQFVSLLNPVVESEVAMLAEVGHLQEGCEQLARHTAEPRSLPAASLQVISDTKCSLSSWSECPSAPSSPASSRLGSRKSSMASLCSIATQHEHGSSVSCSTPLSNASSSGTLPAISNDSQTDIPMMKSAGLGRVCSSDSGFRSQDALHRQLTIFNDHNMDSQSLNSECMTPQPKSSNDSDSTSHDGIASVTWPDLNDTAQFERAASAILNARPHTISAAYERGHPRPALSVHTFQSQNEMNNKESVYSRPPLPTRCSSLERPAIPAKNTSPSEFKAVKPTPLPPHLTKEMPAVYVNMSELATLAASRANQNNVNNDHPHQEKVCSESSASESSLESSSGYGSQGAFAGEDHPNAIQLQHPEDTIESEVVLLRRDSSTSIRDSFSISLGSLEEAVRSLDEVCESQFATIGKKPAVPKRRPLSLTASVWTRRGSASSLGKPPPPIRRTSSISRSRQNYTQNSSPNANDADNLPPPPAFLLQPENDAAGHHTSVADAVSKLNELKHTPASPSLVRRNQENITSFHSKGMYSSNTSLHSAHLYGHTGQRMSGECSPQLPRKNSLCENRELSSFGPRMDERAGHRSLHDKTYSSIYAQPQLIEEIQRRGQSVERRREQSSLIASLSAKLAPQLSPRTTRRTISSISPADSKCKNSMTASVQPGFLDKLSATIQQQRKQLDTPRANTVRDIMNKQTQPDPRACHNSLMEQIKRGATLKRNKHCNDRSAPKIR